MKDIRLVVAGMFLAAALPVAASVTVSVDQIGADVVATSSGSINLAGLINDDTFLYQRFYWASAGYIPTGIADNVQAYFGFSGPDDLGTGPMVDVTTASGNAFAINASGLGQPYVFVPIGYISGSVLSSTSTVTNTTIASLGFTPGTYTFTLPQDNITVNIGSVSAVPEPGNWAMTVGGLGFVSVLIRRNRQSPKTACR